MNDVSSKSQRPSLSVDGWLATLGGSGRMGDAPGTIGSAEACILAYFLPAAWLPWAILAVIGLGIWASGAYARRLGATDPGEVVIDEVAGQWLTLLGHMTGRATAGWLLPGLLVFRLFDILKPWPISRFEKLPGGLGIMADDLAAGLAANLCLCAFRWGFFHQSFTGVLSWF